MQNLPRFQKPKTAKIAQWLHGMLAAMNSCTVGRNVRFSEKKYAFVVSKAYVWYNCTSWIRKLLITAWENRNKSVYQLTLIHKKRALQVLLSYKVIENRRIVSCLLLCFNFCVSVIKLVLHTHQVVYWCVSTIEFIRRPNTVYLLWIHYHA